MSYEAEFDEELIGSIAKKEFEGNEFKIAVKHNKMKFGGTLKARDAKEHFKRMRKVFE